MDPEVKGEGSAVNTTAATLSPERSLTGVPSYLKPVYQKLAAKVTKLQLSNKVRDIVRPFTSKRVNLRLTRVAVARQATRTCIY